MSKVNYLMKSQRNGSKEEFSYSLCMDKPNTKRVETLDFNIQVFEVPANLNLAQAIKMVEAKLESQNASQSF